MYSSFNHFIVLSRSRTGSNMLISFLNSHPNIRAGGEVYKRLKRQSYDEIFAKAFAKPPPHIQAKGFKIFYYHPLDDDSGNIWKHLIEMDNLRVIHLKRQNILRTLISRKIAGYRDLWYDKVEQQNMADDKAVAFTPEELRCGFEQTRQWEAWGDKKFANHPLISVYYEELANAPEAAFREVTNFLGVGNASPKTTLKKQNPESLRDLLSNYDELKSAFSGTQWQEFFVE